jgi:5-formyltetrahydrofolate cyclo-ligase
MIQSRKKILRDSFRTLLRTLSPERRKEAALSAYSALLSKLHDYKKILSFASLPLEINLWPLIERLAQEKRLLLPKITQEELTVFWVNDLTKELLIHPKFSVLEPNPLLCKSIDCEEIDCILLPGLAFDKKHMRLGYGLGYYDRLIKKAKRAHTIGVGYQEQLFLDILPKERHDVHVEELLLF